MTRLDDELAEQPGAVAALVERLPAVMIDIRRLAAGTAGVTIVARGSSDNAARYGQYLIPLRSRRPVALATPSLTTIYDCTPDLTGQLVVAISQSGRSTDIVSVVADAHAQGAPTVVITNEPSSPLAEHADLVVDLGAGAERSVAATKTYTTSLVAVAALAVALGLPDDEPSALADLRRLPELMRATVDAATTGAAETAEALRRTTRAVTVGRGLNLSTAYETALKITELTATQVVAYSPADLLHGPVGAVGPDVPVLLVAPPEAATTSVLELLPELARRAAPTHILGWPGNAEDAGDFQVVPAPADVPAWLSPITTVLVGQLIARDLAVLRGVDVDHPGGLAKVTVTH